MADWITYVGKSEAVNDAGLVANAYQTLHIPFPAGLKDGDLLFIYADGLNFGGGTQMPASGSITFNALIGGIAWYGIYTAADAGADIIIQDPAFNLGPSNHYFGACHVFRTPVPSLGTLSMTRILAAQEAGEKWTIDPGFGSTYGYVDAGFPGGGYPEDRDMHLGSITFVQTGAYMRVARWRENANIDDRDSFANGLWLNPDGSTFTGTDWTTPTTITINAAAAGWTAATPENNLVLGKRLWDGSSNAAFEYANRMFYTYTGAASQYIVPNFTANGTVSGNFTSDHLGELSPARLHGPLKSIFGGYANNGRHWFPNFQSFYVSFIPFVPEEFTAEPPRQAGELSGGGMLTPTARKTDYHNLPYEVSSAMIRRRG